MAKRKKVAFKATKIVKVPVRVRFTTYDGERVSFIATRAVRKPVNVNFYAKKKKKR